MLHANAMNSIILRTSSIILRTNSYDKDNKINKLVVRSYLKSKL